MSKRTKPEVSGTVSNKIRNILWARAAGRCHYQNCNRSLIGDLVSGNDELIRALVAHIVSAKPNGPRGDAVRSPQLGNDISNLMLLCYDHHRLIDVEGEEDHPECRLLRMKAEHERRVEILTDLTEDQQTHLLTFGASIGNNQVPLSYQSVRTAVLPGRYPANGRAIHLEMKNCQFQDHEPEYWTFHRENLTRQFRDTIDRRIESREIRHLSVFGLAPQLLLIELGRLLCDICAMDVHQLKREPKGWGWLANGDPIEFQTTHSEKSSECVALKLALSATVTDDRIHRVLGADVPIWSITASDPYNDIMRRAEDVSAFRRLLRKTFERIKAINGPNAEIHVFPAMPLSAAIETGRTWMPKADLPLTIYDENPGRAMRYRSRSSSSRVRSLNDERPWSTREDHSHPVTGHPTSHSLLSILHHRT